jgi:hypothetical protein
MMFMNLLQLVNFGKESIAIFIYFVSPNLNKSELIKGDFISGLFVNEILKAHSMYFIRDDHLE